MIIIATCSVKVSTSTLAKRERIHVQRVPQHTQHIIFPINYATSETIIL